jgi:hypothetical protein
LIEAVNEDDIKTVFEIDEETLPIKSVKQDFAILELAEAINKAAEIVNA